MGESSPLPERIGDYHVLGKLGEGGMGSVLMASAPDGRLVAVKVVCESHLGRPEFRERFKREAEAAQQVPRFCTAEVLDFDVDATTPYIVTEYIEGPTLQSSVHDGGPWSPADLDQLGVTVAAALTAIHNAGVVHGDLKPGNVLLSQFGPRVIDFGVARACGQAEATDGEPAVPPAGTPEFMAPEQFEGKEPTGATDVFAWGALMVFAATGRYPFGTGTPAEIAERVTGEDPDLSGLDERIRGVVAAALAKDPAARPDAQELLDLLGEEDTEAEPAAVANGRLAGLPPPAAASGTAAAASSSPVAAPVALDPDGPATAEMPPVQELRAPRPVNRPPERPGQRAANGSAPPPEDAGEETAAGGNGRRRTLVRTAWTLIAAGILAMSAAFGVISVSSGTGGTGDEAAADVLAVDSEVTEVESFEIAIGEWVAAGQPGPGAGELTGAGEQEVYAFEGLKGQKLYLSGCSCEAADEGDEFAPAWSLRDPTGQPIEQGTLCTTPTERDQELPILPANGRYRLALLNTDGTHGQFSFELSAPPEMPEPPESADGPGSGS